MYGLKKNGKVFTSKFVGTGPSSYEKRIYRAAVSQRFRNTDIHCPECSRNVKFDSSRLWFTFKLPLNAGGSGNSVSEWPNGGLVQIKKEPVSSSGGSSTPCLQVAEVTTSIRPQQQNALSALSNVLAHPSMAAVVKLEAAPCSTSPCNGGVNSAPANGGSKSMQHPSINSSGKLNPLYSQLTKEMRY